MKRVLSQCGLLLLYTAMACILLRPLVFHLGSALPAAGSGDPLMQVWVMHWNIHKLSTSLAGYFDANIFYPYENTFAYHDHMFGLGLLGWPILAISGNHLLPYNVLLMLSFVLSAYGMFCLSRELCGNTQAAALAGLIFGFLPYRFAHLDHLNLLSVQWIPWCLLFLTRLLLPSSISTHGGRPFRPLLDVAAFWCFFLLQVLTSFNYLFMLTFVIAVYGGSILLFQALRYKRLLPAPKTALAFLLGACLVGLLLLPFIQPYLQANREMGFERTFAEIQALSADIQSYFAAPEHNWLYHSITQRFRSAHSPFPREQLLFPGVTPIVLAVIGLASLLPASRRFRGRVMRSGGDSVRGDERPLILAAFLTLCAISVLLSLGPSFSLATQQISLPYAWLYRWLPGFKSMRVPARFGLIAALSLAVLASFGLCRLHECVVRRRFSVCFRSVHGLTLLFGILVILEYASLPLPMTSYPGTNESIPPVYRWLVEQPDDTRILELPVRSSKDDFEYTYYSTFHWKRLVNGRSAFIPYGTVQLFQALQNLPQAEGLELLKQLGVQYVLVHTDRVERPEKWNHLEEFPVVETFGPTRVLRVSAPGPRMISPYLRLALQLPKTLLPGERYRIGLLVTPDIQGIASPLPEERLYLHLQWSLKGSRQESVVTALQLPPLFRSGETAVLAIPLDTPVRPGKYQLSVSTESPLVKQDSAQQHFQLSITPGSSDSRRPHELQAEFLRLDAPERWPAGQALPVELCVRNLTETLWRSQVPNRHQPAGEVHLGVVSWSRAAGEALTAQDDLLTSRGFLPYDIGPGQQACMTSSFQSPKQPGEYRVELNLVSELIQWFPQDPLSLRVTLYGR